MKSRILASLFAATAIFAGASIAAHAQCPDILCLPDGTPVTCQVNANGTKVWVDGAGNAYAGGTGGTGDFVVAQCACGGSDLTLIPTGLNIVSDGGPFGIITTTLDPSAPIITGSFKSNNLPNLFPATEVFGFHVQATSTAFPGQVFRGASPLIFASGNVNSFNPHRDEPFAQAGSVDFIDAAGNVAFTLQSVVITLN